MSESHDEFMKRLEQTLRDETDSFIARHRKVRKIDQEIQKLKQRVEETLG